MKKTLLLFAVKFNRFERATVSERNSAIPLQKAMLGKFFSLALNFSKVRPTNVARLGPVFTAEYCNATNNQTLNLIQWNRIQ